MGLEPEAPEMVSLAGKVEFQADLVYFLPVKLSPDRAGMRLATPHPTNTSGDFVSLAETDGFIELPRGQEVYQKGMVARLFRW
jgi:molybdopterin molybdotransferase